MTRKPRAERDGGGTAVLAVGLLVPGFFWSMLLVGLGFVAWGATVFCAGFFAWSPKTPWKSTEFWDALLGRKWTNRLAMLMGAAATAAGVWLVGQAITGYVGAR